MKNASDELRKICRLRSTMAVSAIARRSIAGGSSGTNGAGIRRRAEFGSDGVSGPDLRRGTAELQFQSTVESVAVRLHQQGSNNATVRADMHERHWDAVVDGDDISGPHDVVAVLAGQSQRNSKTVQAVAGDSGISEFRRDGAACGRWDEDSVAGVGTEGAASRVFGKDHAAVR